MPTIPPPVGPFSQTIYGDALNNSLPGGNFADLIYGGDGDDVLTGRRGNDYLDGGDGDDILQGGQDDDTLIGGTGDDTINSGGGSNLVFGGDGNDRISLILEAGEVQTVYGGAGADTIEILSSTSGFYADLVDFHFGEDTLIVRGQTLQQVLSSGVTITSHGTIGLSLQSMALGGEVRLSDVATVDLVNALDLSGDDQFNGSLFDEWFEGEGGNDIIFGQQGNDSLSGGDGDDVVKGGEGDDLIGGDRGNDQLFGGDGNDEVYGRFGNNLIYGEAGNDTLSSGRDNSTLDGGTGDDFLSARMEVGGDHVLTGGDGADTFDFYGSRARRISDCLITDFDLGDDTFTINGVDGGLYARSNGLNFIDTANGAVLTLGTGSSITFASHTAAELTAIYIDLFV